MLESYKGIMVYIEQRDGKVENVSLELLGEATKLAKTLNTTVSAAIIGKNTKEMAEEVEKYGANYIYIAEDDRLEKYLNGPYSTALSQIINQKKPEIVLVGATSIGRDLAPRVSGRVNTGLTADCTSLEICDKTNNLLMTRPAFGGNLMATIICKNHRPQMSTVRPGVMLKLERDENAKAEIEKINIEYKSNDFDLQILEEKVDTRKKANIEEAKRLVSCGRGVGSKENISIMQELANKLEAEISCSRAVIDVEWMDKEHQVGQTGKTVRPELYMAMGISGAVQHVAGMENSDYIIAINKNSDAPIFEVADLGLVADVNAVVPELIKLIEDNK